MADYYFIKHADGMAVVQYMTFSGVSKTLSLSIMEAERVLLAFYEEEPRVAVNVGTGMTILNLTQIAELFCPDVTIRIKDYPKKKLFEEFNKVEENKENEPKESPVYNNDIVEALKAAGLLDGEKENCHIQCKCGADYRVRLFKGTNSARCRDCGERVFADRTIDSEMFEIGRAHV